MTKLITNFNTKGIGELFEKDWEKKEKIIKFASH